MVLQVELEVELEVEDDEEDEEKMVVVEMKVEPEVEVELRPSPPPAARMAFAHGLQRRLHAPSGDAYHPLALVYPPCPAPSSATSTSRNSAPMLSTCYFVTARTSKVRTTAPMFLAVWMAARPSSTRTLAGGTCERRGDERGSSAART